MTVVYDENNHASHIEREIIVRFDPAAINTRMVDDTTFQAGHLKDVLREEGREMLAQKLGFDASGIEIFKIFTQMTSADTLSIDRLGDTIRIDNHWASFVLQLPKGWNEQKTCEMLNSAFPLVRYAHLNWIIEPHDAPLGGESAHVGSEPPVSSQAQAKGCPNLFAAKDEFYNNRQASLHSTSLYPQIDPRLYGHINVEGAWRYQTGKSSVKVGVVDSGINAAHPDLNNGSVFGQVVTSGYDFLNNAPRFSMIDDDEHGTACAGIIGARRNNTSGANTGGIAGIAGGNGRLDGVQLTDLKIWNSCRVAPMSVVANAIVQGSSQSPPSSGYGFRLNIMNNSWGGT